MISVRRIRIREGDLYKQLRLVSLRESPAAFATTLESALCRTADSWAEQADSAAQGSARATLFAFADDAPIGIAALYRNGEGSGEGELLQMWVSPEYRSRGVAINLLDTVFEWAENNGFRTVVAKVAKGNARALRFYQKYGFRLARKVGFDSADDSVVLMRPVEDVHAPGER